MIPSPTPRKVFDNPTTYWNFLTQSSDDSFEDQHFDRKEAGHLCVEHATLRKQLKSVRNEIKETISAFANSNVECGLLVLGIASDGAVHGIDHLSEQQKNSLTNFETLLHNQAAEAKPHLCTDASGNDKTICLIFVPYIENGICETPGQTPKSWKRRGPQNILMTQEMRDQTRTNKRLLDFENSFCCRFYTDDIDRDVLTEFRKVFSPDSTSEFDDERLLYEAGAIVKQNGEYWFTNVGLLFFGSNPQRVLPGSYIRLLRFMVPSDRFRTRGLPTFEQQFTGPITKQIREARTFFRKSAFFKRYQKRKSEGGFIDEPEFPPTAIDEAIVNAVAHRDYRTGIPIECESYSDAFIVKNPGRLLQRNIDLPNEFSLSTTVLDSKPRNPKLLEWLKLMKNSDGVAYVQAISEGTKEMLKEMKNLDLPAPSYRLAENETLIKLESNAVEREAVTLAASQVTSTEFGNLFLLRTRQGEKLVGHDTFNVRSLALSIQANPGVYAVLVGSGVSRAAEIPTGWEITLDLIRNLAKLYGEACDPDPERWYKKKFEKDADYADLLDELARTPADRQQLLRGYYEPNDRERDEGKKKPTAAHRAIAVLAAQGFIKVIITTNFDRLVETALTDAGVVPTILSSPDQVQGALPLIHTQCCVFKVHGDYLDSRIRNTPAELDQYPSEFNRLLDQIFDEFGLIVCGWSAEWDGALRKAIYRAPSRRFTTYWAIQGKPGDKAKRLIDHRKARMIPIKDADAFFDTIQQYVESIKEFSRPPSEKNQTETSRLYRWVKGCEDVWRNKIASLPSDSPARCPHGFYTFAYHVDGGAQLKLPELRDVLRDAPSLTGWNTWWVPMRQEIKPYVSDGAIECWIGGDTSGRHHDADHSDFWRVKPDGLAFLLRGYQDDGGDAAEAGIQPGTCFDPTLPIWRIGEGLLHATYLAGRLGGNSVSFFARYTGLHERRLTQWVNSMDWGFSVRGVSRDDEVPLSTIVAVDTLSANLVEVVHSLLSPLYERFDFTRLPLDIVQHELNLLRKRG